MPHLENFNYKIYGPPEGRKWVFLHGLMGFLNNWRSIIKELEATECCLTFDQRGHGRSMKPPSGYAPENYADDLNLILQELGWSSVILVGHSMGGRNALNFGSRFPDKLQKLVIEDIAPAGDPEGWRYYERLFEFVPASFANRTEAREFFQGEFKEKWKSRNVDVLAAYFYANMEDKKEGGVSWRFSPQAILESAQIARQEDRWQEVKSLKVPTLWIRGENSDTLSQEDWQKVMDSNPLIQGVEVKGAGHWVHSDQPQAFIEHLKAFVGGFS